MPIYNILGIMLSGFFFMLYFISVQMLMIFLTIHAIFKYKSLSKIEQELYMFLFAVE